MGSARWRRTGAPVDRRLVALVVVLVLLTVGALVMSGADSRGTFDGTKDVAALRPGDCVALPEGSTGIRELTVLECDEPHDAEVVGIIGSENLGGQSSTAACVSALIGYADPERLSLTRIEPRTSTIALPVRAPGSADPPASFRCIADLRDSPVEPRSLRDGQ